MKPKKFHRFVKRWKHGLTISLTNHINFTNEKTGSSWHYARPHDAPAIYFFFLFVSLLPFGAIFSLFWSKGEVFNAIIGMVFYGMFFFSIWGNIGLALVEKVTTMRFSHDTVSLRTKTCGITERKAEYRLHDIRNVREGTAYGVLEWDGGDETIRWNTDLNSTELSLVIRQISEILTFRCHTVTCILFGDSRAVENDSGTLRINPDFSDLTVPCWHLQQIIIYSESSALQQVEQFLTYAVNSLGTAYLKRSVAVTICGDPEKLHPNIRNALTHLCKRVTVSEEKNSQKESGVSSDGRLRRKI